MKKISIVIPTYNEQENVVPLYEALKAMFAADLPTYDYDILFIDNASKDRTRALLRELCQADPHVRAIFNLKNFGQNNSPFHGLCAADGDAAIMMCADFQDPVDMIPQMVKAWEEGHEVVCCVKTSSRENKLVRFFRTVYYHTLRKMSEVEIIEHFTGFGLYDRSFLQVLRSLNDPMPFLRGLVAEYGVNRLSIPYTQQKRRAGKSKNNFFSLYDIAMLSFTSYTKIGLRIATLIGAVLGGLSILLALAYLVAKLIFWDIFPAGNIPTLLSVLILGSVQLFFLGLLGEYVLSINNRIINRPLVIEQERINFPAEDAPVADVKKAG